MIDSVILHSGIQQSDSVIHTYVSIFQILFPFSLFQNIEQSSLCDTVSPSWLTALHIAVCICLAQTLSLSLNLPLPLVSINAFCKSVSLFLF